jgi:hypothetical protein
MFITIRLLFLFTLLLHLPIYSFTLGYKSSKERETVCTGMSTYKNQTFHNLKHSGPLTLKNITIANKLQVNGTLKAKNCKLNHMEINGTCKFTACSVDGPLSVNGYMRAFFTLFKSIHLNSNKATFTQCLIDSITISPSSSQKVQHIYLEQATKVFGDIIFESGRGLVHLKKNSTLSGQLIGGCISEE